MEADAITIIMGNSKHGHSIISVLCRDHNPQRISPKVFMSVNCLDIKNLVNTNKVYFFPTVLDFFS